MKKNAIGKTIFLGFLSWLIPFAVSFLFYKPGGQLIVPYATFKSMIMIIGTISGCYLLFRYFRLVDVDFFFHGVIVGISWFFINILLDTVILIPIMKTSFANYFMSIGLSYAAIPTISVTMGYLLDKRVEK